jgi:hypothetical protein
MTQHNLGQHQVAPFHVQFDRLDVAGLRQVNGLLAQVHAGSYNLAEYHPAVFEVLSSSYREEHPGRWERPAAGSPDQADVDGGGSRMVRTLADLLPPWFSTTAAAVEVDWDGVAVRVSVTNDGWTHRTKLLALTDEQLVLRNTLAFSWTEGWVPDLTLSELAWRIPPLAAQVAVRLDTEWIRQCLLDNFRRDPGVGTELIARVCPDLPYLFRDCGPDRTFDVTPRVLLVGQSLMSLFADRSPAFATLFGELAEDWDGLLDDLVAVVDTALSPAAVLEPPRT